MKILINHFLWSRNKLKKIQSYIYSFWLIYLFILIKFFTGCWILAKGVENWRCPPHRYNTWLLLVSFPSILVLFCMLCRLAQGSKCTEVCVFLIKNGPNNIKSSLRCRKLEVLLYLSPQNSSKIIKSHQKVITTKTSSNLFTYQKSITSIKSYQKVVTKKPSKSPLKILNKWLFWHKFRPVLTDGPSVCLFIYLSPIQRCI